MYKSVLFLTLWLNFALAIEPAVPIQDHGPAKNIHMPYHRPRIYPGHRPPFRGHGPRRQPPNFRLKVAAENVGQSFVIAPYFINALLTLLLIGAEGQTLNQLKNGLYEVPDDSKLSYVSWYNDMLEPVEQNRQLSIVNGVFITNNVEIQPSYQILAQSNFFTNVTNVDFTKPKNVAKNINAWVARQSSNRITNLLSAQEFNQKDKMVLLNAVFYHGIWLNPIYQSQTRQQKFFPNCRHSNANTVEMMYVQHKFRYGNLSKLEAEVIEMPLASSQLRMTIFLPWICGGLSTVEQKLVEYDLSTLEARLNQDVMINVTFPKFQMEFMGSLKTTLTSMGMGGIFSKNANFSGMIESNNKSFRTSDVIHKVIIHVDEDGQGKPNPIPINRNKCVNNVSNNNGPTKAFTADHPFVFMIRKVTDYDTNILLMGRYVE